jgi:hypothetical protein
MKRVDHRTLKTGDTFYCRIPSELFTVTSPSEHVITEGFSQWKWKATDEDGNEQEFLATDGYEEYAPSIYDYPAYVSFRNL